MADYREHSVFFDPRGKSRPTARAAARYALSVALVAATLGLALALSPHLTGSPSTPFFAAVAVAAWLGVGPGLVATILSALVLDYFLIPPLHEFNPDLDHFVRTTVFVIVSMLISYLSHANRRETRLAKQRAEEVRRELTERQRIEKERAGLLKREREAREQAETAELRVAFVAEAGRQLAASLDVDASLEAVARLAVPAVADACIVYLAPPGGDLRRPVVVAEGADPSVIEEMRATVAKDVAASAVGRRVQQGERILFAQVTGDVLRGMTDLAREGDLLVRLGPTSLMVVPLEQHRQVFGAIVLLSTTSGRVFSHEDLAMADDLAGRAAAALSNAQLYEQARTANQMKDEFLATVSHELRTPLHAILGWSRLLRSAALEGDAAARALETIERNAQAQSQLVADILDMSRIVSGKVRLDLHEVVVATVVEAALDAVRPSARAKDISIEAHVARPTAVVLADPGRLQQILWNLLVNSIKFTPAGGHVLVEAGVVGRDVEIAVSDTGIGISPDFLPYVFERFRQADGSTTRSHGGLGLGLAIVRHMVELHGGHVWAESEGRGAGATFVVRLPAVAQPASSLATAVTRDAGREGRLSGVRVLAVDDQEDARALLAATLERHGAAVSSAASVRDAFDLLSRRMPDVIVADIGMPEEDGYALIARLRELPPDRGGRLPAIAVTAYARREDREQALAAGYQAHLAKPVEEAALADAVASLVGRART